MTTPREWAIECQRRVELACTDVSVIEIVEQIVCEAQAEARAIQIVDRVVRERQADEPADKPFDGATPLGSIASQGGFRERPPLGAS